MHSKIIVASGSISKNILVTDLDVGVHTEYSFHIFV